MTGSTLQLINGVFLLTSFAGARLVYGSYISVFMIFDIYRAVRLGSNMPNTPPLAQSSFALNATALYEDPLQALQVVKFAPDTPHVPVWMWGGYLASNFTLHILNWYWYGKMIAAIRKRFDPPLGTRTKEEAVKGDVKGEVTVSRGVDASGKKLLEVESVELRKRIPMQRFKSSEIPPPN
jgi:TLC domain